MVPGCLVSISIAHSPLFGGVTYSATPFWRIIGEIRNKDTSVFPSQWGSTGPQLVLLDSLSVEVES